MLPAGTECKGTPCLSTQVKGLEFNSFSPNLLASGGVDGDLCIWDVGNPAQPSLYPAMKVWAWEQALLACARYLLQGQGQGDA